ncbi:hypothetical protein [Erwinia mallotivora]|uniref:Uncharacterized protein n=1 Tax=Erwinia mallotivora TaxID=69222 RepID=A0A014NJA6_9GAMM|nr:hypothetical protein [Erwinia mallotivora]EXU73880.1 hypothetical protein BG55_20465 [Erwinia mallotivora]
MKEPIFKQMLPDGRVAVTLLVSDIEIANELFKIAKKNAVEVVEAEPEKPTVNKTADKTNQEEIFKRISAIADQMTKKAPEKQETLAERLANKIKK